MPESERRQVTVLFADISGFTAISERADPEAVTSLINECFGFLGRVVEERGGTIDKYIGDCIMALFGAPRALEDAASRAVDAALEMRKRLHAWRDAKGMQDAFDIHIGVNSGEAISGRVGAEAKQDYTVMGDAVNVASRLKDAAPRGRILVGPVTWRHTQEAFDYRERDALALKGKEKPVKAYEVVGRRRRAVPSPDGAPSRRVSSDLVGRQRELDRLELHVLKAINGEGSIVFLRGEAGVGKSRLLAELRTKDSVRRVTLLRGSAQSMGANLSYQPFRELLDAWAGVVEEDGEPEIETKLESAVGAALGDEAGEVFPFLAVLRGLSPSGRHAQRLEGIKGDALAKLIAKSLRDLLKALAARQPVVLILEDAHWADQSSLDLVQSLARLVPAERVFLLVALRPSEPRTEGVVQSVVPRLGAHAVVVDVEPLGQAEAEHLVANLVRNSALPRSVLASINERTGGNPFFIEEIVRSWIDDELVVPAGDGFRVRDGLEHVAIPYTVNQAVMARIDRLDEETKELLRRASVIGRSFFYRVLERLVGETGSVGPIVARLTEMQLLLEGRRMEEVELLFKHALVQQAIYDSILLQKRKTLHRDVAMAIESIFEDRLREVSGILAYHYVQAEDLDKAEQYLLAAGEASFALSASAEAVHYFQEGLNLYLSKRAGTADPVRVAKLEEKIGLAIFNRGLVLDAAKHFETALSCLGRKPAQGVRQVLRVSAGIAALVRLTVFPRWTGRRVPDQTRNDTLRNELNLATCYYLSDVAKYLAGVLGAVRGIRRYKSGSLPSMDWAMSYLATAVAMSGASGWAKRLLSSQASTWESDPDGEGSTTVTRLYMDLVEGSWGSQLFDAYRDMRSLGKAALYVNFVLVYCGLKAIEQADFDEVRRRTEQLRFIGDELQNASAVGCHFELQSKHLLKSGRAEELVALHRSFGEHWGAAASFDSAPLFRLFIHGVLATALLRLGRRAKCEEHLAACVDILRANRIAPAHFRTRYTMARLSYEVAMLEDAAAREGRRMLRRRARSAARAARIALRISRKWIGDRTEALRLVGTCAWVTGRQRRALRSWQESMRLGERLGARLELARTWAEVGKRLLEGKSRTAGLDGVSAREYLTKAEAFFEEKELRWDLARLREAPSGSR